MPQFALIIICFFAVIVYANDVSAASTGQVLIVFDDGNAAGYDVAFQYMKQYDMNATAYVNGATIGQADGSTMTLAELKAMDSAGWTIANHGYVHQDLTTIPIDQAQSEISDGINYLLNNGLTKGAYDLAYPGGAYNDAVEAVMENLGVQTGRTIDPSPQTLNSMFMYQVGSYVVQNTDPVNTIETMIDQAKNGQTVVLLFHGLVDEVNPNNPYEYLSSDFKSIIDYINVNQISTTTIDQLYTQKENSLIQSAVAVTGASGYKADTVNPVKLIAKLTANGNVPGIDLIDQQTIHFYIDNVFVGNAITDSSGTATLSHVITDSIGSHNVVAKFVIGTYISASQGTSTLQVNLMPTNLVVKSAAGLEDSLVNLVATLTDTNGQAVAGKSVLFSIDGNTVSALTNTNGVATLSHKVTESLGPHTILATFTKDDTYDASSDSNTLTAGIIPTSMVVSAVNGATNSLVNLVATLTDNNNQGISGKSLEFFVDDISQGKATTDASGTATLSHTVSENQGSHIIKATFVKDDKFDASSNTNTLTVPDTTAPTAWDNLNSGLYNTNKLVTLAMSEPGTIYYTLNGGIPNTQYTNPITITQTCNLNYKAVDMANNPSPTYSKTYSIDKIAPKVSATSPSNKRTKVSKTSTIIIKFSENIYTSTYWSKIYVKNLNKNKKISISKKLSSKTLTIKTSKRSSKTKYQVYIPGGSVKDTAGNNIAAHYSFNFKTA